MPKLNLIGCKFGKLTVIEETDKKYKGGSAIWICKCECGTIKEYAACNLRAGNTKCCGHCEVNFYSENKDGYMECTTESGLIIKFDKEDYEIIKSHRWRVDSNKYAIANIDKKPTKIHRLLMNPADGFIVDHKNGDPLDNRRENLRVATQHQNTMNRKKDKISTSKYKGVTWDKIRSKWCANITINKRTYYLGRYKSEKEAAKTYNEKAIELFGEFAKLNAI